MVKLMKRLGHDKFYLQGGDWGALIGNYMVRVFPENILGYHSNMCASNHPRASLRLLGAAFFPSLFMSELEMQRFPSYSTIFSFLLRETGRLHIQATKPDTIGTALSHSPIGLAAYILETYSAWTNSEFKEKVDGALTKKFSLDELLDDIMIYWVTNSITTSMRLYVEALANNSASGYELDLVPVKVPTACIVPRNEGWALSTESMAAETFQNLSSYHYAEDGGHFFSMEHPDLLANDIIPFVNSLEKNN
jgi:juvenile hormone epoxide hydrolase